MNNIDCKGIDHKELKQKAKGLPVAYITPKQFKKLTDRKDIDYNKLKIGQLVGTFRGHQLVIQQQIYIRYYNKKYSAHPKSKVGKEMLIANFPLGRGKII